MPIVNLARHPAAFVSIDDLALYLGVGRSTLYEMAKFGELATNRLPGRRLIMVPIIEARRLAGAYSDQDCAPADSSSASSAPSAA